MAINSSTATAAQRLKHELREYALLSAYLYVCFTALVLYKMAILGAEGIGYLPFGLPAIKALILAKFILLGLAIRSGDRHGERRIAYIIAEKTLLYLVMLIVLSIVEEAVVGVFHGRTIAASLTELVDGKLPQICAASFIMLLILIPYLASRELNARLGEGRLWQILFERHAGFSPAARKRGNRARLWASDCVVNVNAIIRDRVM
jgi:hypothetical protein